MSRPSIPQPAAVRSARVAPAASTTTLWRTSRAAILGVAVFLGSCGAPADYGDYERPEVVLPTGWRVDMDGGTTAANLDWWRQFGDPELEALILSALDENRDLRAAAARLEEFAGRARLSRLEILPEVDYAADAGRSQRSLEEARPLVRNENRTNSHYFLGGSITWELDFWGRIQRANEASLADLMANEEARKALALSLVSAVATTYLELLSLDVQLEITRQTLDERRAFFERFEVRSQGGQVSGLELAQVQHTYEELLARVPALELAIARTENRLSELAGRHPGPIRRGRALEAIRDLPIPGDVPSDLLERRPDIREQEQRLVAAHARMREVRTRYFPRFSLTGIFGYSSAELSDWLQESAGLWDFGAGIAGPLFTGGRLAGQVRIAEAQREQLLQEYFGAILTALREVDDALVAVQKRREMLTTQQLHIETLERYSRVARESYDAGLSGFIQVLDADRNLYNRRIEAAATRKDIFLAMVETYKAMGGGWSPEPSEPESSEEE